MVKAVFIQFRIVRRFALDNGLDFIDFSRFHVGQDGRLSFEVSLEKREIPSIETIQSLFGTGGDILELNEDDSLWPNGVYDPFCYRYRDFTAGILQKHSLILPESHPNLKVKIKTSHPVPNRIIKIHLYQQYSARDTLLLFLPENYRHLQDYLADALDIDERYGPDDFSLFAEGLKKYKLNASKQGVLFLSEGLDKRGNEFIHYLLDASGRRELSYILLGEDSSTGYDLELRENASDLFGGHFSVEEGRQGELESGEEEILKIFCSLDFPLHQKNLELFLPNFQLSILESLISQNLIRRDGDYFVLGPAHTTELKIERNEKLALLGRLALVDDSLPLRLNYLAESGLWQELKQLLNEYLVEGKDDFFCSAVVLSNYQNQLLQIDGLLEPVVEILFREGFYDGIDQLAACVGGDNREALVLKKAHVLKLRKDHQRMFQLLERLKGKVPPHLEDEYFYLKFVYYDKISKDDRAAYFREKIKGFFYNTLVRVHSCTRLIYGGRYSEAKAWLDDAIGYLKDRRYHRDSLQAQCLMAKLLREQGEFRESERIYQNICVQGESRGFHLLAAYFSIDLGNLYVYQDDFGRAEYWYKRALKVFEEKNNENGVYLARSNLMDVYKWQGAWRIVENYSSTILSFDREKKLVEAMGVDFFNIAHLEYLKRNFSRALSSVNEALKLFRQRQNKYCIIEGELLKIKILASRKEDYSLRELEMLRDGFTHDHAIAFRLLVVLKKDDFKKQRALLLGEFENCQSRILKYDLLTLYIRLANDRSALKLLKDCSLQLCDDAKNYFYYEYYYLYFELLDDFRLSDENAVEIFNEVYYFFSRNKRILSQGITRIKEYLDERDTFEDVFKSADLVGSSQRWRVPDDFFQSFLTELKKIIKADLVKLVVFEKGERVFSFYNINEFESLTGELLEIAIQRAEHLALDHDDIISLCTSNERAFYKYIDTRVLLWRVSSSLFGGIVLGFTKDLYRHTDVMESLSSLLKKFAPLLSRFYESDYNCNEKLAFIVGESRAINKLKQQILKVSKVDFAVLVNGESGGGKELVAKGIHRLSRRAGKPFVPVNAAAIPENLLEAELFGYVKGAFSGATDNRVGLIESADTGTLFLDEIGELPLSLQAKLLRVLQEQEIRRLGANSVKKVDIRLICATNKDLVNMCKENRFREDLFYRIQDLTLRVPPLRERMEDLPLLFRHFLEKYDFSLASDSEFHSIARYWQGLEWPGNVRELESCIRRLITFYPDLEAEIPQTEAVEFSLKSERETFERGLLLKLLNENGWNKIKTADQLKISRMSLFNLIKKYNIRRIEDD